MTGAPTLRLFALSPPRVGSPGARLHWRLERRSRPHRASSDSLALLRACRRGHSALVWCAYQVLSIHCGYDDGMAPDDATAFALERPPVRQVVLTLGFTASPPIQGWHLASFYNRMRDRYLSVEEVAPRPSESAELPYEILPADGGWPIPRSEFAAPDRALALQGDQLEVQWNFGSPEQRKYVGFESLIEDLSAVYEDLVSVLAGHDIEVSPSRAECYYVNAIEEFSATELAVGVLTDWAAASPQAANNSGYVGVRMHSCPAEEKHNCSSLVMVDSQDDGHPNLSLRVRRQVQEEPPLDAMNDAHEELIELFKRHTSDELRRGWGEI